MGHVGKLVYALAVAKILGKLKVSTTLVVSSIIKLILTSLLYNYCAMFVLADRGMHVLHIDVLKNGSIVDYVVFDFDLLLSDDNGFQYSTNHHSNDKNKD